MLKKGSLLLLLLLICLLVVSCSGPGQPIGTWEGKYCRWTHCSESQLELHEGYLYHKSDTCPDEVRHRRWIQNKSRDLEPGTCVLNWYDGN